MTNKMRNYTLPLSSEPPAQAESAEKTVANGAISYNSYC